jgi:hypothetical protein
MTGSPYRPVGMKTAPSAKKSIAKAPQPGETRSQKNGGSNYARVVTVGPGQVPDR